MIAHLSPQKSASILLQAGLIVLVSCLLGFTSNTFSSKRIPLDYRKVKAEEAALLRAAARKSNVPIIHLKEALALHRAGTARFMDARSMESYSAAHIPGAVALPVGEFTQRLSEATAGLNKDDLIVTYCSGAGCHSSVRLAEQLMAAGFQNVKAFLGGWEEWTKAGLPTVSGGADRTATMPSLAPAKTSTVHRNVHRSATLPMQRNFPETQQSTPGNPLKTTEHSTGKKLVTGVQPKSKPKTSAAKGVSRFSSPESKGAPHGSVKEIYALFQSGDCIFIDARLPEDYARGHIPGAVSLPLELFNETWPKVTHRILRGRMLVTYCDGADCNSSEELAEKLRAMGFSPVQAFVGGWNAWRNAGYPIETGP